MAPQKAQHSLVSSWFLLGAAKASLTLSTGGLKRAQKPTTELLTFGSTICVDVRKMPMVLKTLWVRLDGLILAKIGLYIPYVVWEVGAGAARALKQQIFCLSDSMLIFAACLEIPRQGHECESRHCGVSPTVVDIYCLITDFSFSI